MTFGTITTGAMSVPGTAMTTTMTRTENLSVRVKCARTIGMGGLTMDDLIRRSDVMDEIDAYLDVYPEDELNIALRHAKKGLKRIPTVDAVEVVHAYWIDIKGSNGKDYHKCANCLHEQEITGVKNYCAVCGARMDGQRREDGDA